MLLEREREKKEKKKRSGNKKATSEAVIAQTCEPTTLSWCLSAEGEGFHFPIKQLTESKKSLPLH